MLTIDEIRSHYQTPAISETIVRVSTDECGTRAGMKCTPNAYIDRETHELTDLMDWYRGTGPYTKRKFLKKIDLSTGKEGITQNVNRTLYWTLNVFDPAIYDIDFKKVEKGHSSEVSREYTTGYTFGIDIDKEHGKDIHDPDVKQAVEDMARYFCDKLREYAPNSVYCLYSGGGIYVLVHHNVFSRYFEYQVREDWDTLLKTLLDSFDAVIEDIRDEFFKIHPEHKGKVKPDQLNGSQRVFKTIFSIHKSLDYAVIPLDPENIKIDFERATIPLKPEVIESGREWYTKYDDGREFLNKFMKPYFEKIYEKIKHHKFEKTEVEISENPCYDVDKWAPCMRNIYLLPKCGEGATRALAILTSYVGQIGIEHDDAYMIFNELADRWNARKSNLFESYFRTMRVPTCQRLTANDNRGFPKGVSIKRLGVCKPCVRCMNVPSPYYYTDAAADKKRMLKRLTPVTENTQCATESIEI